MDISTEHKYKQRFDNRNLRSKLLTNAAVAVGCRYVLSFALLSEIGSEMNASYSEIHMKHIYTLCNRNTETFNVKAYVTLVTT